MKKKKFDPFKNLVLDEYEQAIEDALGRGEFVSDSDSEKHIKNAIAAAKRFLRKKESKSITLRVKKKDLIKLKAKAAQNNVPYQTLTNMLINSFNEGKTKLVL